MVNPGNGNAAQAAALFIKDVLGLDEEASALVSDMQQLDHTVPVTTFAIELGSSAGPAAFLVYVFALDQADEGGISGRQLVAEAVATLAEAERLEAPGPRALASGEVGPWGVLLATTPSIAERLIGGQREPLIDAARAEAAPDIEADAVELAESLLASLRETNHLAETYLAVVENDPAPRSAAATELALYLTDSRSLAPLLALVRSVLDPPNTRLGASE